jgi:hypothetical protein
MSGIRMYSAAGFPVLRQTQTAAGINQPVFCACEYQ